ncbi:insulin-like growth factor 3 [Tachysurus ichikawai]
MLTSVNQDQKSKSLFHTGHPGAVRSAGPRRRAKGIVEQCCVRGCDLQYLEHYCAKPKRERRHTPHTPHTGHTALLPQTEDWSWMMFLRGYEMNQFKNTPEKFLEKLKERALYRRRLALISLQPVRKNIPKSTRRLKQQKK